MDPPLLPAWGAGGTEGTRSFQPTPPQEESGGCRAACLAQKPQAAGPWPCRSPARGGPTSHAGLKAQGRGQVSPSESRPTKGRHRCPTPEGGPPRPEFGTATVQGPGSVEMVGPVLFLDSEAAADGDWRGPGGPDLPSAPSLTTGQRPAVSVSVGQASPLALAFSHCAFQGVSGEGLRGRRFPTSFRPAT